MYPVQRACLQRMLTFLRRVLQPESTDYVRLAMLECIYDVSIAGSSGLDNWCNKLQSLLAHVSQVGCLMTPPAAIDVGIGWAHVDVCMVRWRSFYHY